MRKPQPPAWATRFFRAFCNDHLSESVLGDMMELYGRRCHAMGKRKADFLFIWNVIQFIQPFALRRKRSFYHHNTIAMFENYLKVAWRTMLRQKMYAGIMIGGFALGLATCLVIALFIRHELSYDTHYSDAPLIFRMYNEYKGEGGGKGTAFPAPIAQILKSDYPDIEMAGRLIPYDWFDAGDNLFRREDQTENMYEKGFAYSDQELIDILSIPMVYGDRSSALDKPNTMMISERIARKYFPGEDPVGKIVILNDDNSAVYTIGGVMENFPPTSHLQYDFFLTLEGKEFWPGEQTSWCCWNYSPYLKIKAGTDPTSLEKKLSAIRDTYFLDYLKTTGDQRIDDFGKNLSFHLQPLTDIHLYSSDIHDVVSRGDIRYVWLFGGIAVFILLLACINFINLSTARSANRAREVGLRKAVGSVRGSLVRQFMTESMMYSFVSFLLAVVAVTVALPYFNTLADKSIIVPWGAWWFVPSLLLSILTVGVLAGMYPSFYLSSFKPIDVLKGSVSGGSRRSGLRNVMVVFQFTTSIVLIIGTMVIYRQMNYILNTKIGYDKEQVITLFGANTLNNERQSFREELLNLSPVEQVTFSDYLPVLGTKRDQNLFWRDGKSKEEKSIGAQKWYVDENYIETMGMELLEGRNFDPLMASDSQAMIINEAMAEAFNFKDPVGERIMNWETYTVIGVVKDFNFETMKGKVTPLCFVLGHQGSIAAIKVRAEDMQGAIQSITETWKRFMPHQPVRYSFLDESYARMYSDVQRMGYLFACFALLAIAVACLGLFALSAFMAEQRAKEISIRLVLGASVNNVLRLLTQSYVKLVLIAFAIAAPLGWYLMQQWLEDYAYRIDITWDVFVVSGLFAMTIALITVSYQSIRAALANPANSLRSE